MNTPTPTKASFALEKSTADHSRSKLFTLNDMRDFATEAWGMLGSCVVDKWATYNEAFFGGRLRPIPLVITHRQPQGHRTAVCSYPYLGKPNGRADGRTITVNVPLEPGEHGACVPLADNNTLLHEMVHQCLIERDANPSHASESWRREIMRLQKLITGSDIWAGRLRSMRDPSNPRRVIRLNEASPTGKASLTQAEIARWPHRSLGVDLGKTGN